MVNVNEILDGHVALEIKCLDRIYLNGYVPILQVGRQVINFMTKHLGKSIPSPAILEKIGTMFRQDVKAYAEANHIPVITFKKDDRKIDVMHRHILAQERTGRSGVAAIGVAQEYQNVFAANRREGSGVPWFSFTKRLIHYRCSTLPSCWRSRGRACTIRAVSLICAPGSVPTRPVGTIWIGCGGRTGSPVLTAEAGSRGGWPFNGPMGF